MLIPRNNFDHDPPWKYRVMIRTIRSEPIFIRIGLTDTFRIDHTRRRLVVGQWEQAWGGKRYGGRRYKDILHAMQAVEDFCKRKDVYEARIEHVYYEP